MIREPVFECLSLCLPPPSTSSSPRKYFQKVSHTFYRHSHWTCYIAIELKLSQISVGRHGRMALPNKYLFRFLYKLLYTTKTTIGTPNSSANR